MTSSYVSIVENNDVPYPAAIGKLNAETGMRNIYYLIDYHVFGPMKMNIDDDVYEKYWNDKQIRNKTRRLLSFKYIAKRDWGKPL